MSERKESLKSPAKLPRSVRLLLLGVLLSAMGNGLVFSFLFIYLHQVREIPSAIVGLISGYGALVGLVLAPVVGSLIDHWGPKSILLGSQ